MREGERNIFLNKDNHKLSVYGSIHEQDQEIEERIFKGLEASPT